jgi:hypothetical protein
MPSSTPSRFRVGAEAALYLVWAGGLTLWVAGLFFASMHQQIRTTQDLPLARASDWSAPLDDVFIHFDFARAIARGHPFEWSEGNGYSSGGTSALYPFVLAFGYWIGFRKLYGSQTLMLWAGIVACVSVLLLLWWSRRAFRDLPRWTTYLAPPALLGIGVLDWSFFSGMEVAFFLALWAGTFIAYDNLVRGKPDEPPERRPWTRAGILGGCGALLVATRPEAIALTLVFALFVAFTFRARAGAKHAALVSAIVFVPGLCVTLGFAFANRILTGDFTAAGALVKLEMYHPHLDRQQVFDAWVFHSRYQLLRVAEYHLGEVKPIFARPIFGWIPFLLALVALVPKQTRRTALLLIVSAIVWVLVVALNGQVRWQNERYTMPALAWVLLAAALGAGALVSRNFALGRRGLYLRVFSTACVATLVVSFAIQHQPRFRDQVWFFGRASRNIRDQHIRVGRLLREMQPPVRRVLVGDAGAIPYASDLPALDIIGLGGQRGLPFARATRQGVGAAVELIERMQPGDRPEIMAIYPSWWGAFPLWFGQELASVPVSGNVICGGAEKVIYRADWSALERESRPDTLLEGERVVDAIDFADIVSEREHALELTRLPAFVEMKRLPHLDDAAKEVFDAGRVVPEGGISRFRLYGVERGHKTRIVLRFSPASAAKLKLFVDDALAGEFDLVHADGWVEQSVVLDTERAGAKYARIEATKGEHVIYHAWVTRSE